MISFQAKMRSDIYALYKGILYGFCPCHGYNKKEGKTGGFYHMVCRHGVSYSKSGYAVHNKTNPFVNQGIWLAYYNKANLYVQG